MRQVVAKRRLPRDPHDDLYNVLCVPCGSREEGTTDIVLHSENGKRISYDGIRCAECQQIIKVSPREQTQVR